MNTVCWNCVKPYTVLHTTHIVETGLLGPDFQIWAYLAGANNQTPTALGQETTDTELPTTDTDTIEDTSNQFTNLDTDGITKTSASTQTVFSNTGEFIEDMEDVRQSLLQGFGILGETQVCTFL